MKGKGGRVVSRAVQRGGKETRCPFDSKRLSVFLRLLFSVQLSLVQRYWTAPPATL